MKHMKADATPPASTLEEDRPASLLEGSLVFFSQKVADLPARRTKAHSWEVYRPSLADTRAGRKHPEYGLHNQATVYHRSI